MRVHLTIKVMPRLFLERKRERFNFFYFSNTQNNSKLITIFSTEQNVGQESCDKTSNTLFTVKTESKQAVLKAL